MTKEKGIADIVLALIVTVAISFGMVSEHFIEKLCLKAPESQEQCKTDCDDAGE